MPPALLHIGRHAATSITKSPYSSTFELIRSRARWSRLRMRRDGDDGDDDASGESDDSDSEQRPQRTQVLATPSSSNQGNLTKTPNFPDGSSFCFSCVVADNDARLLYNGPWLLNIGPSPFTTHSTTTSGASVSFRFNGSAIVVFGTVPMNNATRKPPTASYTIDANPPFTTAQPNALSNVPNQPLFGAFQLSSREHQLTITVISADTPYILDHLFVFPQANITQAAVESSSPTIGSIKPSTSNRSEPATTGKPDMSRTIGILAGTLGTLITLVALTLCIFIVRKRRQALGTGKYPNSFGRPSSPRTSSRETIIFTTTESIMRNEASLWSNSFYARSDIAGLDYRTSFATIPPQLPPKT